jgi:membrane protein insertase Oxa1/YidC/SpoIIIJ
LIHAVAGAFKEITVPGTVTVIIPVMGMIAIITLVLTMVLWPAVLLGRLPVAGLIGLAVAIIVLLVRLPVFVLITMLVPTLAMLLILIVPLWLVPVGIAVIIGLMPNRIILEMVRSSKC